MVIYDISLKMDVFYMQEYSETLHYAFLCHARKRKRKKKIAVTFSACLSISIPYFSLSVCKLTILEKFSVCS